MGDVLRVPVHGGDDVCCCPARLSRAVRDQAARENPDCRCRRADTLLSAAGGNDGVFLCIGSFPAEAGIAVIVPGIDVLDEILQRRRACKSETVAQPREEGSISGFRR